MDKYTVLKQYFGHGSFRPGQEELIDAVLSGRDVLGVMPTGGGKSVCYQVPALLLPGVTLVVSPLISLMKDQVAALRQAGVPAAYVNGSLTAEQQRLVWARARAGQYKLLYVAPERMETSSFAALLRDVEVPFVAVDEAHCISQWGQDFRPSYLRVAGCIAALPRRPVVAAFTATATAEVRQDIVRLLRLQDPLCRVTGFDRPNLFFDVQRPRNKREALLALLRERADKSGIVYCATRAGVEKVCACLGAAGIPATRYHAGLDEEERRANQDDFRFDRKTVMVATNAFGMGIDKSNVSFVIHYNMPKSLEAYYQEAGRAGRDGSPADCILLYSQNDIRTARMLLSEGNDAMTSEQQAAVHQQDLARLEAMIGYCRTRGCLRGYILDYFGQPHEERCAACGNCCAGYREEDITVPAQMILSCAVRVRKLLGYDLGKGKLIQVLRGSGRQQMLDLQLDRLSTYGLLKGMSAVQAGELIDYLLQEEYLAADPAHGGLYCGPRAAGVLFQGEKVTMPLRADRESVAAAGQARRSKGGSPLPEGAPDEVQARYQALKEVRIRLARRENVPLYVIFSNATLADMAVKAPRTIDELLEVSGVGLVKAERYGRDFLQAIAHSSL